MKKWMILLLVVFNLNFLIATCLEGQVDINSASETELVKIIYVGEVRAKDIVANRPFEDVDSLIEISGIGELTLEKIKAQGLACVGEVSSNQNFQEEDNKNNFNEPEETQTPPETKDLKPWQLEENLEDSQKETPKTNEQKEISPINLNPKVIKSEENTENQDKENSKYEIYGLAFFCILLGSLFFIRKKKKVYENEFS